jgi:hypothetical protein
MDENATPKQPQPANRKLKDTLFTLVFGNEATAVELSNTFLGTRYGPDTKALITTLKNVLSNGRINDLSFILDNRLIILIEHQATLNENMPYRMLQYIAETYKRLQTDKAEYGKSRITLKRPKFIVLYNGTEKMPDDEITLRLSDLFADCGDDGPPADGGMIDLELTVKMYNINYGHNEEKLKSCATLHQYSIFIETVRKYNKTMSLGEATVRAVEDCIDENVLKEFLLQYKGEVVNMLTSEWSMSRALEVEREEGIEIGMEKRNIEIAKSLKADSVDVNTIAKWTGLAVDDILRL